jgi:hypothetical protein
MVPAIPKGITKKKKWIVECPNIPSALCPVPHCEDSLFQNPSIVFP